MARPMEAPAGFQVGAAPLPLLVNTWPLVPELAPDRPMAPVELMRTRSLGDAELSLVVENTSLDGWLVPAVQVPLSRAESIRDAAL